MTAFDPFQKLLWIDV